MFPFIMIGKRLLKGRRQQPDKQGLLASFLSALNENTPAPQPKQEESEVPQQGDPYRMGRHWNNSGHY